MESNVNERRGTGGGWHATKTRKIQLLGPSCFQLSSRSIQFPGFNSLSESHMSCLERFNIMLIAPREKQEEG